MEKHLHLKNILTSIISEVKKQDFLVYFRKMSILEITENSVVFGTVSAFMKDNIEAKFLPSLLQATQEEFGEKIQNIELKVDTNIDNPSNTHTIDCTKFYKESQKQTKKEEKLSYATTPMQHKKGRNERYNLTNFIV